MMPRTAASLLLLLAGCASTPPSPDAAYILSGTGTPAVVFEAGLGDGRETWGRVIPALARDFTVFARDRPGTGANPAVSGVRDPCTIAHEEHALLHAAGVRPPYLLVGHSLGGLYQYAFAKLYPSEVVGFVLLDPTHPDNWQAVQQTIPEAAALIKTMKAVTWSTVRKREFDDQVRCLDRLEMGTPLVQPGEVLVSGRPDKLSNAQYERRRLEFGRDWARMTGVERIGTIWGSGHYIQREGPDEVVAAIRRVARPDEPREPKAKAARTVSVDGKAPLTLIPGETSAGAVANAWGRPDEEHRDGAGTVWIYGDKSLEPPLAVSLLPVVGDIADAVGWIREAQGRHELVLQFDRRGLVSEFTLRDIE
ncbi:alpha/beta fold hydrolase [Endothiovibrio diazotrophicus]